MSGHLHDVLADFYPYTQSAHARERAVAIGSSGKMAQLGATFGDACQHAVAVRDGFIAWELNPSVDGFGGMNSLFFHQWILARRIRRMETPRRSRAYY